MKKLANFIVDRRYILLAVILVLSIVCGVVALHTEINKDRSQYLSDESQMKEGMGIMGSAFPELAEKASIRVMFSGLSEAEIPQIKEKLLAIPNVSSVTYDPTSPDYNKENYTLFVVNTGYDYFTDEEKAIEKAIATGFPEYEFSYQNNDIPSTKVPIWLLATAVLLAAIILIIMSPSWLDPVLFLFTLAFAAVINFGTNFMLPYIDEMTATVGPILQMVLSMDYSIILISRYRQEKGKTKSRTEAMKNALAGSFSSIASSSLTTMVGLLALVFLSFKLGPEMGIVLAKGVIIGMLAVFTVLPTFILLFDPLLEKTKKKCPHVKAHGLANVSFKARRVMPVLFVLLLVGSYILQGFTVITFTEKSEDPLAHIFPKDNTIVLLYANSDEAGIHAVIEALEKDSQIKSITGYTNTLGLPRTAEEMCQAILAMDSSLPLNESLVHLLYYLEAGEPSPLVTPADMIAFLLEMAQEDSPFSAFLDDAMKENLTKLETFADKDRLTTPISATAMAEFLEMDTDQAKQLYLYYGIQKGVDHSTAMPLSTFVDFILGTVAKNPTYGEMLDQETLEGLTLLSTFTDKEEVTLQRTAEEISALLGIDVNLVKTVFFFAQMRETMSLEEFVNTVSSSTALGVVLDEATKAQLATLKAVVDATVSETDFTAPELSALLGFSEEQAEQLYLLYLYETDSITWDIAPLDLVSCIAQELLPDESFGDAFPKETKSALEMGHRFMSAVVADLPLSAEEMWNLFSSFGEGITGEDIALLYLLYGSANDTVERTLTVPALFRFISQTLLPDPRFASLLDESTAALIKENESTLNDAILQLKGEEYSRLIITSAYPDESPEALAFVDLIHSLSKEHLSRYYLIGSSVMVHEIDQTFRDEYLLITLITAISIFLVVLLAFRRPVMPLILTLLVQCGVFITVTVIGAYSGSIFYLALLIVQSILMGATIDYGIVFCNAYREHRPHTDTLGALRLAYQDSMHTIMCSGSILVLVLAALGTFATSVTISEVCVTLSIGSFVAILLILFVLPGTIACFDKLIYREPTKKESPALLLSATPKAILKKHILLCCEYSISGREVAQNLATKMQVPFYDLDLLRGTVKDTFTLTCPDASAEALQKAVEQALLRLAQKEPAVLFGENVAFLIPHLQEATTVFFHAGEGWKAEELSKKESISLEDALTEIRERTTPTSVETYDLSLSREKISISAAVDMILMACQN